MSVAVNWIFQETPTTTQVPIYPLDTDQTLRNRVLSVIYGVEGYTYFSEPITLQTTNVDAVSLYAAILPTKTLLIDLVRKYDRLFSTDQIAKMWLIRTLLDSETVFLQLTQLGLPEEYDYYYNSRDPNKFSQELEIRRTQSAQLDRAFLELDECPTATPQSVRKIDKEFEISFALQGGELAILFDTLKASPKFPVIVFDGGKDKYLKILKRNTNLYGTQTHPFKDDQPHIRVAWVAGFAGSSAGSAGPAGSAQTIYLTRSETRFRIFTDISNNLPAVQTAMNALYGELEAVLPVQDARRAVYSDSAISFGQNINTRILSALLLEDRVLERFYAMNEYSNLRKAFGSVNIYFSDIGGGRSRFVLKQVLRSSTFVISFKETHIKIIEYIISKLVGEYFAQRGRVIMEFSRLGIELEEEFTMEEERLEMKFNPVLFGGDYSRKCQKQFKPVLISDAEAKEIEGDVLLFPRAEHAELAEPQFYTCPDKRFPFVGLVANSQSALGFQPCCFKKDQRNTKNYQAYYNTTVVSAETAQSGYLFATDKLVPVGKVGKFPEKTRNVPNMVSAIMRMGVAGSAGSAGPTGSTGSETELMRYGIPLGPSSFLSCLNTATKQSVSRQNLLQNIVPWFLAQEFYDYTRDEIVNEITNENVFLDPYKTVALLEYVFQCNILVYTRDEDNPYGNLITPRHTNGYSRWKRDLTRPFVVIYMHAGADSEKAKTKDFLHCELVSYQSAQKETVFLFSATDPLVRISLRVEATKCYNLQGYNMTLSAPTQLTPVAQKIDPFGKTIGLEFIYQNQKIVVDCFPIPPLNLPLMDDRNSQIGMELAKRFIQSVEGEVLFTMRNSISFQVAGIPMEINYSPDKDDILAIFIQNEKTSRYLVNWGLYRFSEFLAGDATDIHTKLTEFVKTQVQVRVGFVYPENVSPFFADVPSFAQDKIICNSLKLVNALVYHLRLLVWKMPDHVLRFRSERLMTNYYKSIWDFHVSPNERLMKFADEPQNKLAVNVEQVYPLFYTPTEEQVFFIQHPLLKRGRVCLATQTQKREIPDNFVGYVFDGSSVQKYIVGNGGDEYIFYSVGDRVEFRKVV